MKRLCHWTLLGVLLVAALFTTVLGQQAERVSVVLVEVPVTVMRIVSAAAITAPRLVETQPDGNALVMWMANAASTGDSLPSDIGGTSSSPSSSMNRAP